MPEGWPQRGAKRSKKTDGVVERWSGGVVEWDDRWAFLTVQL